MALRRGVALVFTLIGMAVLVSIAGIVLLYLVMSRGPTVASGLRSYSGPAASSTRCSRTTSSAS